MSTLVHTGLAGALPKLVDDLRASASELFLRCAARVSLFWLVLRVCCGAFLACVFDARSPFEGINSVNLASEGVGGVSSAPRARWFRIGDSRTAASCARIVSARSRRERFLFEQLYLARRVPCAEELEAICRGGWVDGDPVLAVEFASLSAAGEHTAAGSARIALSRGQRRVGAEVLVPLPESSPSASVAVFPFPFGAIDLAEIHSRVWPCAAAAQPPDGARAAAAIARARARLQT